jgi:hypothetical protein
LQRACGYVPSGKVKPPALYHRFVIALHSPDRVPESGLRICLPEKEARRVSAAGGLLRSGLVATIGNCGDFAPFFEHHRQVFSTLQTVRRTSFEFLFCSGPVPVTPVRGDRHGTASPRIGFVDRERPLGRILRSWARLRSENMN